MAFFTPAELARAAGQRVITLPTPCPACSSTVFVVDKSKGPHRHLRCGECGHDSGWWQIEETDE
jgi:predicted Zn finger-like uncharacterized protein